MAMTAPYEARHEVVRDGSVVHWDDVALLVARLAFVALFLPGGLMKLMDYDGFTASLAAKVVWPGYTLAYPEIWAALAIAAELVGSLLLLFGFATRWAALLLAAFVVFATVTSHRYWEYEPAQRRTQEVSFYKNVAITGGLLALMVSGAGAVSTDGRRRLRVVRETKVSRTPPVM